MSLSCIFIRPGPRWWDTKGDIIFAMYLMRTMKLDYTGCAQEEVPEIGHSQDAVTGACEAVQEGCHFEARLSDDSLLSRECTLLAFASGLVFNFVLHLSGLLPRQLHPDILERLSCRFATHMAQPARKKQRTTSSVKSLSHSQSPTTIAATDPSSDDQIKTSESELSSEGTDNDAQTQPFRFLDLSPELRINIYEIVASAQSPIILSNKGHLQVDSRLCSVSRQVRSEYLSVFEDAPEITTVVSRFNFGPTISFINRLSEERVNKFSSFSKSPIKRTINIRLLLPGYVSSYERAEIQQFQGFLTSPPPRKKVRPNPVEELSSGKDQSDSEPRLSTTAHSDRSSFNDQTSPERASADQTYADRDTANQVPADQGSTPAMPFRFLDLAPELRDAIYQMDVTDHAPIILKRSGRLIVKSKLCAVSRQVRDEYLTALEYTPEIKTIVERFDLRPIVTFLNRLSQAHAHKLSRSAISPENRSITIIFKEPYRRSQFNDALLKRWLNRFETVNKRGLDMNFSYSFRASGRIISHTAQTTAHAFLTGLMAGYTGRAVEELQNVINSLAALYRNARRSGGSYWWPLVAVPGSA
ncbi:uncharacterized protein MYCGRDRAFT_107589 [Zymoseptoria tritici IPO323]|uniref:Uncharacterized protein n=1 Tax=Zymoseptoria tritici (strain CBS 115943 / IPO323) TaxID=336722 RepID=F9WWZ9_ZYMTI|nr:uncharacterized protein MYCGRDRAFT_107589 [Zymoseptoria tritici IPO323]EGP92031.1 hypothetical protein MYCGRDRAFT_107589 [Zymoseptoria tritici IPO323]